MREEAEQADAVIDRDEDDLPFACQPRRIILGRRTGKEPSPRYPHHNRQLRSLGHRREDIESQAILGIARRGEQTEAFFLGAAGPEMRRIARSLPMRRARGRAPAQRSDWWRSIGNGKITIDAFGTDAGQ